VSPLSVVVVDVPLQNTPQMRFIHDDHVTETFPPYRLREDRSIDFNLDLLFHGRMGFLTRHNSAVIDLTTEFRNPRLHPAWLCTSCYKVRRVVNSIGDSDD
jgi:hypothetical protein